MSLAAERLSARGIEPEADVTFYVNGALAEELRRTPG